MRRLTGLMASLVLASSWFAGDADAVSLGELLAARTLGENFGVQVKEWETTGEDLDKIKAAGFGLLRYGIGWPYVEQKVGTYVWEKYDQMISGARARGFRSIVILTGGHPVYTGDIAASRDGAGSGQVDKVTLPPTNPTSIEGFARFVAAAVRRYQGDDITWEIWNEPDLNYFWPPKADADAYVKLAMAACSSIRGVVPSANVIGPASASMPGHSIVGPGFSGKVLQSPLAGCLDGISFHSYRVQANTPPKTPESVMRDNELAVAFIRSHSRTTNPAPAAICSEWGYSTLQVGDEQQADYVLRTHLSNVLSGVAATIWYEWRDSPLAPDDPEFHFGLVDGKRQEKVAMRAPWSTLPLIRDDRVERRLPAGGEQDYVVLLRSRDARQKLVVWTTRDGAGQPVYLESALSGKAWAMTSRPQVLYVEAAALDALSIGSGPR
jgi:hypothetical protein